MIGQHDGRDLSDSTEVRRAEITASVKGSVLILKLEGLTGKHVGGLRAYDLCCPREGCCPEKEGGRKW